MSDETFRLLFKTLAPIITVSATPNAAGIDFVLPMSGEGFTTYNREPNGADQFGLESTINAIVALARKWFLLHPEARLQIGDISRRDGGTFPPHASYRNGRDADVRSIRRDNRMDPISVGETQYDTIRTEEFVKVVLNRRPTAAIFFNDQRLTQQEFDQPRGGTSQSPAYSLSVTRKTLKSSILG